MESTGALSLAIAVAISTATLILLIRGAEIRLVLLGAALLMTLCAGRPLATLDNFGRGMVSSLVAPICSAMGFAAVLSATQCDRHLVRLLMAPLKRVPWLMLPGAIVAAYIVNAAIPSQAAAAAAIGPILVPLMMAAGIRAEVAGASLLLGASFGGDLLNPGDQNVQAIVAATGVPASTLTARLLPAGIGGIGTAAAVFAILHRGRKCDSNDSVARLADHNASINYFKAAIPLLPIALLLTAYSGWSPFAWLLEAPEGPEWRSVSGSLPVVRAMLIGVVLAAVASWRELPRITTHLFDGMARGYGKIISMIISAQCFGAGLAALGVSQSILAMLDGIPGGMEILAVAFPWGLAVLSGSGSGPIFTFAESFLKGLGPDEDPAQLGALCCMAGSFGRTMSPVAPVVIYCSGLVGASPIALVRLVVPALSAGATVSLFLLWFCH